MYIFVLSSSSNFLNDLNIQEEIKSQQIVGSSQKPTTPAKNDERKRKNTIHESIYSVGRVIRGSIYFNLYNYKIIVLK